MWLTGKQVAASKSALLKATSGLAAAVVFWSAIPSTGFAQGGPMGRGGPNGGMMGNPPGMMGQGPPPGGPPPRMHVDPYDPNHVMALKNELQLTDKQLTRLGKILSQSQQLTEKLLTKEQKKKLQSLGSGPGMGGGMGGGMGPNMGPPGGPPGGPGGGPPGFNQGGRGGPPPGFNPGGNQGQQ
jgi:hypothetical protein